MSWLRVNGWAIPVSAQSGDEEPVEIGARGRAHDGSPYMLRRAIKRTWKGRTVPRDELEAQALVGAIMGLGSSWSWGSDLYSGGGLGPLASSIGTRVPRAGADGADVYDENSGDLEVKYGSYSLTLDPAATNILSSNSASAENAPTGFATITAAILSADTTNFYQGAKSLGVATNINDGAKTDAQAITGGSTYCASVYFKEVDIDPPGNTYKLELRDNTGLIASKTFTGNPGKWQRVFVSGASAGGAINAHLRVVALQNACGFYIDGCQIELGTTATSWVNGTRAAAQLLKYPAAFTRHDFSMALWARAPSAAPAANQRLLLFRDASANSFSLRRTAAGNGVTAALIAPAGTGSVTSADFWNGHWHHVAVVWRFKEPSTGQSLLNIYVDGVLSVTAANTTGPNPIAFTEIHFGQSSGTQHWSGLNRMDDVVIVPYAMHANQVAALAAFGVPHSPLPRLYLDGDVAPGPSANVIARGRVSGSAYVGAASGGAAFNHRHRALEVTFDEVSTQATPT